MKKDKTEIVFVCDRSGSMNSIKSSTEKGFSDFIKKQQKESGECFVSLYEFDDKYEPVYENININDVKEYSLVPRGWTALLDAIGFTITRVGNRLDKTQESERPSQVLFVVLTDGEENRSKEYTKEKIKEMIEHQSSKYSWKFIFLGSNQDAITTGKSYGFSKDLSLTFTSSDLGTINAFSALCNSVSCLRGYDVYAFSDEERKLSQVF